jgi:hypothetical protein
MKTSQSRLPLVLLIVLLTSCFGNGVKTKLSEGELKWVNVYKAGDTLLFKSNKGDFDTTLIIKKEIFYPTYNPIEVHDKYLPQWGIVWYKNKKLKYHPKGDGLITMIKKKPKDETSLSINYLYSGRLVLSIYSKSFDSMRQGKIYLFDTEDDRHSSDQPKMIYWHQDYGIVKYVTQDSTIWERINLPK